jgi:hypothetical protein
MADTVVSQNIDLFLMGHSVYILYIYTRPTELPCKTKKTFNLIAIIINFLYCYRIVYWYCFLTLLFVVDGRNGNFSTVIS